MPDRHPLTEAGTVTLTEAEGAGTALVTLITPGVGSSGEYSSEVLESAAEAGVFAAGTHMYLDHPAAGERPERSLRNLAGVLTEAATWDGTALKAPAKIYPRFRAMLADVQDAIGVSIRADGVVESGVVKAIGPVASVDFVTKAGRGGSFALVESAVLVEGHGMTANDLSQAISDAVREAYGADQVYTWVRDYTDEWAVFSVESSDSMELWQQTYTVTDGEVALTGDKVEVREVTTFVPAAPESGAGTSGINESETTPIHDAIASTQTPSLEEGQPATALVPAPTTTDSLEETMSDLTEAEVQTLREAAAQLPAVTAERDEARAELAAHVRRDAARPIIATAMAEAALPARTIARLTESVLTDLPTTTDGTLDEDALRARVAEAITAATDELNEALGGLGGAGAVHGLGTGTATVEESAPSAEYAAIYGTGA